MIMLSGLMVVVYVMDCCIKMENDGNELKLWEKIAKKIQIFWV